ncbi:preprotein translocase subunit Sec61beta [archaeon CG_4_8_14_3_um_filter_38_5]|nr:MAG: preprotein translocase subunit Sec61beta [archaeon CG07_land_8_20_14_0_80_38_8]PIU88307.1 MAG: preprotein translocase subunit Sec61beta [archaeon CG06_land_8_20_14_3_00_37_11]PIX42638.1 MAG: preprotein translocase subunit Sec61beta [archaeon CG_4_8_14_3_um_filter_38_5]
MKDSKRLPASTGGIVQYFDDAEAKSHLTPKQVIILTGVLIIIVLLLKWTNLFGI